MALLQNCPSTLYGYDEEHLLSWNGWILMSVDDILSHVNESVTYLELDKTLAIENRFQSN